MGDRIRRMDAKQIDKILKQYGFELISQKGSYRKWRNFDPHIPLFGETVQELG
jgi:predicted RNA binding protein YcfA (HicA-like mRNA interferase family)